MASIQDLLAIRRHNKSKFQDYEFERMVIRDGNNKFRIVDRMPHFVYEHWFTAADGTPVHSICSRDYNAERLEDEEKKFCRVCDVVKSAWTIWNDSDDYSRDEVFDAGVIIGKERDRKKGFEASWGGKLFAYMNVIDRDGEWCAKNQHTKVLSKSEKQAGISAGDKGQLDEFIECVDENGEWLAYDIRMKKQGKKLDTKYRVYKDKEFDLPEEEDAYKKYAFAEILKPTDDKLLEKWLTEGVKRKPVKTDEEEPRDEVKEEVAEEEVAEEEVAEEEVEKKPTKAAKKKEPKRAVAASKLKKKMTIKKEPEPEPEPEEEEEEEEETDPDVPEDLELEEAPPPAKSKSKKKKALTKKKPEPEPEPEPEAAEDDFEFECPSCSHLIKGDVSECPQCGAEFEDEVDE